MPDVSVIIPAWNAQAFIGRSIAAALAQTGVEVEVLVVDDASTDDTAGAVAAIGDPRVRYIRQARNGGPAVARNTAFAEARGDWLLILDADDDMGPGRAADLLAAAHAAQADIVADNLWITSEAEPGQRRLHIPETLDDAVEVLGLADYMRRNRLFQKEPSLGYLKPMFRKAFLDRHALAYDPALRIGEDYALVAEALVRGARYVRRRSADYVYVTREGSISHRLLADDLAAMVAFDKAFILANAARFDAAERDAAQAHLGSLLTGAAFTDMVDGLKARQIGKVLGAAIGRPTAMAHFSLPIQARLARLRRSRA